MLSKLLSSLWVRSKPETPPPLPYRCGTMLLNTPLEQRMAIFDAWRRDEGRYIAWVEAHPRSKREWVEVAADLRQQHNEYSAVAREHSLMQDPEARKQNSQDYDGAFR